MTQRDNLSFDLIRENGWRSSSDFYPLSSEAALYTEGKIYFRHNDHVNCLTNFMLEFYIEIKTVLFNNFGSTAFDEKFHLPYSAHRIHFYRRDGVVCLEDSDNIIMKRGYRLFIEDFAKFQCSLKINRNLTFL